MPEDPVPGSEPPAPLQSSSAEVRVGESFDTFERMDDNFRGQWTDEDLSSASPEEARKRKDYQENLLTTPETPELGPGPRAHVQSLKDLNQRLDEILSGTSLPADHPVAEYPARI